MNYVIRDLEKDTEIGDNQVISEGATMVNSSISFRGSGNVLFLEPGAKVNKVILNFVGNNSLIYISKSKYNNCSFQVNICHDSVFYIGENTTILPKQPAVFQLSEYKNIFIGSDNMLSSGITSMVADPHLIYSAQTKQRTNPSKSVYIGDHVWIGQDVNILKGVQIGSGSIIAGNAVLTKRVPSNTTFGGAPAKKIKSDIFWLRPAVHMFTKSDTKQWERYEDNEFIFENQDTYDFNTIENELEQLSTAAAKLDFLKQLPKNKNRFFIADELENARYKWASFFKFWNK